MNTTPTDHYQTAVSLIDNAGGMTTADGRALVTAVRGLTHAILAARPAPEPADPVDYSARRELADHLADAFAAGDSSYEAVADRLLAQGYRLVWQANAA